MKFYIKSHFLISSPSESLPDQVDQSTVYKAQVIAWQVGFRNTDTGRKLLIPKTIMPTSNVFSNIVSTTSTN